MVDLSAGSSGGLIEHGFNNYIFLFAGLLVFSVVVTKLNTMDKDTIDEMVKADLDKSADPAKLEAMLDDLKEQILAAAKAPQRPGMEIHWAVYILAFSVVFGVLGFFSYKLVQSLKEKEKKKEEKKKMKEMKKKK